MIFKCYDEKGQLIEIDEKEKQGYINYIREKEPNKTIEYITLRLDGEYVNLEYKTNPIPFERIRRITGYLSEVKKFNNGKQAELKDRVKHG